MTEFLLWAYLVGALWTWLAFGLDSYRSDPTTLGRSVDVFMCATWPMTWLFMAGYWLRAKIKRAKAAREFKREAWKVFEQHERLMARLAQAENAGREAESDVNS